MLKLRWAINPIVVFLNGVDQQYFEHIFIDVSNRRTEKDEAWF